MSFGQFWEWILKWGGLDSVYNFFLSQGWRKRTFWDPDSTCVMVFDCGKRFFAHDICVCMCVFLSKNVPSRKFFTSVFILWTEPYLHLVCWGLSKDFHNPHPFPHQPAQYFPKHIALTARYSICKVRLQLGRNYQFPIWTGNFLSKLWD